MTETGGKKRVNLRRQKLEHEILEVSLARLFKSSQMPVNNLPVSRPVEIVDSEKLRSPINTDLESQLNKFDISMIKSLSKSNHRTVFTEKISEEMERLKDRMKIYGFN